MSNLGVFGWIRESVRRSVLLGFSDAVEQLGAPAEGGDICPQLLAVLRNPGPAGEPPLPLGRQGGKPERKRLGRSLEEIRTSQTSTPPKP